MKIISRPSFEIITPISENGLEELMKIEKIGRVCYHSEDRIKADGSSAKTFVQNILKRGHESVLEHVSVTVRFDIDRGISHEFVRHRLCSFTQESTRYCDYSDTKKYPDGIIFVRPAGISEKSPAYNKWIQACQDAEFWYLELRKEKVAPEDARDVLPTCVGTTLFITTNLREWRHILRLRNAADALPKFRDMMQRLSEEFDYRIPIIFEDVVWWADSE